jgi:hypothetical protein
MPSTVPPVLEGLLALGLTQTTLAPLLGVSQAAISLWCAGKRPFEGEWYIEATLLLGALREHLAAGGSLATFRREPGLTLVGGSPQRVAELRIPPEKAMEYHKLCDELRDLPYARRAAAEWAWQAQLLTQQLADWMAPVDPRTWQPTVRELDAMRRRVDFLYGLLTSLGVLQTQTAEETTDA